MRTLAMDWKTIAALSGRLLRCPSGPCDRASWLPLVVPESCRFASARLRFLPCQLNLPRRRRLNRHPPPIQDSPSVEIHWFRNRRGSKSPDRQISHPIRARLPARRNRPGAGGTLALVISRIRTASLGQFADHSVAPAPCTNSTRSPIGPVLASSGSRSPTRNEHVRPERHPTDQLSSLCQPDVLASVDTPITGIAAAIAIPLAIEMPTRNPLNKPGPVATTAAPISAISDACRS